jgi:hypothetical protein
MALRTHRPRPTPRRGGQVAFQSFFERDAMRQRRGRSRRNTLILSLALHALAVLSLVVYSVWRVDELWTPSVAVKVYSQAAYRDAVKGTVPRAKDPRGPRPATPPQR